MPDDDEIVEVVITAPDEGWLASFTHDLIEQHLIAAGHLTTIRSVYTWRGTTHDTPESRVALHTQTGCVQAIIAATRQRHPYEVPCVISLPIADAMPEYRAWIMESTRPPLTTG